MTVPAPDNTVAAPTEPQDKSQVYRYINRHSPDTFDQCDYHQDDTSDDDGADVAGSIDDKHDNC